MQLPSILRVTPFLKSLDEMGEAMRMLGAAALLRGSMVEVTVRGETCLPRDYQ